MFIMFMLFVDVVVVVSRIHVLVKYSRPIIAFLLLIADLNISAFTTLCCNVLAI